MRARAVVEVLALAPGMPGSRTTEAEERYLAGKGYGSQFMRRRLQRPFLFIMGIVATGYAFRLYTVSQAKASFEEHRTLREQKMAKSFDLVTRIHSPQLNWERVWQGVAAEERRIALEEGGEAAARGAQGGLR